MLNTSPCGTHPLRQEEYECRFCGKHVPSEWDYYTQDGPGEVNQVPKSEQTKDGRDPSVESWEEVRESQGTHLIRAVQMVGGPLDGEYLTLREEVDEVTVPIHSTSEVKHYRALTGPRGQRLGVYVWVRA